MKTCSKCGITKPLSAFYRDGKAPQCAECYRAYAKSYHAANLDSSRAASRKWKAEHPEQTRELRNASARRNSEANRARSMRWRAATPDYRASIVAWNERNPDLAKGYVKATKARRRGAEGSFTGAEWRDLKARYGYRCLACDRIEPEIKLTADHVQPIAKGGTNYIDNIQPLCLECNMRKRTEHIDYRLKHAATPIPLAVAS